MIVHLCAVRLDLHGLDDEALFAALERADEQGATWTATYIRALLKRRREGVRDDG